MSVHAEFFHIHFHDIAEAAGLEAVDTAPWDIWSHFSAIEASGFKSLTVGERVEVTYHRANQDSYRYVAERIRRLPHKMKGW